MEIENYPVFGGEFCTCDICKSGWPEYCKYIYDEGDVFYPEKKSCCKKIIEKIFKN